MQAYRQRSVFTLHSMCFVYCIGICTVTNMPPYFTALNRAGPELMQYRNSNNLSTGIPNNGYTVGVHRQCHGRCSLASHWKAVWYHTAGGIENRSQILHHHHHHRLHYRQETIMHIKAQKNDVQI